MPEKYTCPATDSACEFERYCSILKNHFGPDSIAREQQNSVLLPYIDIVYVDSLSDTWCSEEALKLLAQIASNPNLGLHGQSKVQQVEQRIRTRRV